MSKKIVTKTELVKTISEETGLSQVIAGNAFDTALDTIKKVLKSGGKVQLIGFGSFSVSERAARTGRNPSTGKEMKIPACKVAKFKPGQELKEAVAG